MPSDHSITSIDLPMMDVTLDLTGYAHALGRAEAAWQFAGAELRRVVALATISAAWDIFRRDAGAGAVGPAHQAQPVPLLLSEDPRRDAVLMWLTDHGAPEIAEVATMIVCMVRATLRFSAEELALLNVARDALAHPATGPGSIGKVVAAASRSDHAVLEPLQTLVAAIDRLRGDAGFIEGSGDEVRLALPRGTLARYVTAAPAGCWALNLALLSRGGQPVGVPAPPGLVSRALFRSDLEPEEIAVQLVAHASAAWRGAYDQLVRLEVELARGRAALAHLSRNARARDAWVLVAVLGGCTRSQLARALGLSRAGADIQAHALAAAGLVTLAAGGQVVWAQVRKQNDAVPTPLAHGRLGDAMSDVDASLAEIDRLLARSAR